MCWEIKELIDAVRVQHGDCVADSLREPAESIAWKIDMGHYHACESVRLLKDAICSSESDDEVIAAARAIFLSAPGDPHTAGLRKAWYCAEAHMIAAAQCLHSTADIMAYVVYWALDLGRRHDAPEYHHVSLRSINDYLKKWSQYPAVVDTIEALLELDQFKYLNAYVNTTKHRRLVDARYTARLHPDPRHGFRIKAFQYYGVDYAERWGEQFLFDDAQCIRQAVLAIGNALNAHYAAGEATAR